jgi:hypothetical protein
MTDPDYGLVGYDQRGSGPSRDPDMIDRFPKYASESMTAVGLLWRLRRGERTDNLSVAGKAVDLCRHRWPAWSEATGTIDLYYWLFGTEAFFRLGGRDWEQWRGAVVGALEPAQRRADAGTGLEGSWDLADPWSAVGGRVYSTAVACLILERCYRAEQLMNSFKAR